MTQIVMYSFLTFAALQLLTFVFVIAQALAGRMFGIEVKTCSIGFSIFGKSLWQWEGKHWTWQIGVLPLGSYTKYLSLEDLEEEKRQKQRETPFMEIKMNLEADDVAAQKERRCFEEAELLARLCIPLAGPAALMLVAFALMSCSIIMGADQLVLPPGDNAELSLDSGQTLLKPAGLVGLQLKPVAASWRGHYELASSVASQAWAKFFLFQRLEGWGGLLGWQVTGGTILSHSFAAWCSFVGLMALLNGIYCMIPIGGLNGFAFLLGLQKSFFGKSKIEEYLMRYALVSVLFLYVVWARILYADVAWIVRAIM